MQTSSKYIKLKEISIFHQYLGPLMHLFIRPMILIFNRKRKIKDNNACSMLCFISLKSIDDLNMCKTKYPIYFIAIRSSVSKVLEKN